MGKIIIFDTTLRDGAQAAPKSIGIRERQAITNAIFGLGVDVIEAGFANSSEDDFDGIRYAVKKSKGSGVYVASLARTDKKDIDAAWESVKDADNPMIHVFISTSHIHMEKKLKLSPDEVLEKSYSDVKYAKELLGGKGHVEFSAEDATRTDSEFLSKVIRNAINGGADRINLPDTVGYAQSGEIKKLIKNLLKNVPELKSKIISVHNHNDLGFATANSLEGILSGASQVECTINGVGERAGNASMEEIVAAIKTRHDIYEGLTTNIDTSRIGEVSRLVSDLFGMQIQLNKAIVGGNAFLHRSGLHQDGVLKDKSTYEIMKPADYGWIGTSISINANSGRKGFRDVLENLGFSPTQNELEKVYTLSMEHIRKYKHLDNRVIACMLTDIIRNPKEKYKLSFMHVETGTEINPTASVILNYNGKKGMGKFSSKGPISALYQAIDESIGSYGLKDIVIKDFSIKSLGEGKEAIGETIIEVQSYDKVVYGWGVHQDIIKSAAKAYLSAINKL